MAARKLICIAALVGLFFATAAHAFRGSDMHCADIAMVAGRVADTRDAGVPWSEFGPFIRSKLDAALVNPNSYISTPADVEFAMSLFARIYTERILDVVPWAYATCMAKPGPATDKKKVML